MSRTVQNFAVPRGLRLGTSLDLVRSLEATPLNMPMRLDLSRLDTSASTTSMIAGAVLGVALSHRRISSVATSTRPQGLQELQGAGLHSFLRYALQSATERTRSGAVARNLLTPPRTVGDNWFAIHDLQKGAWDLKRRSAIFEELAELFDDCLLISSWDLNPPNQHGLFSLLREAAFNVAHHAGKQPLFSNTKISSYLQARWVPAGELLPPLEDEAPYGPETETYSEFIEQLRLDDERRTGMIELIVADNGNGIAARHSLDAHIYDEGRRSDESKVFSEAFLERSTVKDRARDCPIERDPGYGFANVLSSLARLSAYASVRSGHCTAECDGTKLVAGLPRFELSSSDSAFLQGTVLHVLIPYLFPRSTFRKPRRELFESEGERLLNLKEAQS